ncbi:hypothetical protein Hanom_Chr01g00088631 [Helianthus anomalus]
MRKNKPLNESRKTSQTTGTKMAFYSNKDKHLNYVYLVWDLTASLTELFFFPHLHEFFVSSLFALQLLYHHPRYVHATH